MKLCTGMEVSEAHLLKLPHLNLVKKAYTKKVYKLADTLKI